MKKSKSKMSRGAKATAAYNEINRAGNGRYLISSFKPARDTLRALYRGTPHERRTHDAGVRFLASVITSFRGEHGCHACNAELSVANMPLVLIVQQSLSLECETILASGLCEKCASAADASDRMKKAILEHWPKGEFRPICDRLGSA